MKNYQLFEKNITSCGFKIYLREVKVIQLDPMELDSMEFSRSEYWRWSPFPSPGILPKPGFEPRSPTLQADSLPAESQGNPKNTGVSSLSLLHRIFPPQESNRGLLQEDIYRRILYQLSYLYSIFTSFYLSIQRFSHDNNYYGKCHNRLVVLTKNVAM